MVDDPSNDSIALPPKTMSELAIHLNYLRRDILNVGSKVDALGLNYVSREDLKTIVGDVESLKQFKSNYEGAASEARRHARWSGAAGGGIVSILAGIILAMLNFIAKLHS